MRPVLIEVKRDERILDWGARLEKEQITTLEALAQAAVECTHPELTIIHPLIQITPASPLYSLTRLEGLFTPGYYPLHVKPVSLEINGNERKEDSLNYNACYIIRTLTEHSLVRLKKLKKTNNLSPYEQTILASLVEKEAVSNYDYEKVASVFFNRLKTGTRLASCPALEYALGYHRPFLTSEDIKLNSPYNLYLYTGLVPTPICFFSNEALSAVTNPIRTPYFFFVFDWTESKLFFAKNYQTHLQNVKSAYTRFIKQYGKDNLHALYPNLFYEPLFPDTEPD